MAKGCGSKCVKAPTGTGDPVFDSEGRKLMIAQKGNKKFPVNFQHSQCEDCHLDELMEDIKWKQHLKSLEEKDKERELFAQFDELKRKVKK